MERRALRPGRLLRRRRRARRLIDGTAARAGDAIVGLRVERPARQRLLAGPLAHRGVGPRPRRAVPGAPAADRSAMRRGRRAMAAEPHELATLGEVLPDADARSTRGRCWRRARRLAAGHGRSARHRPHHRRRAARQRAPGAARRAGGAPRSGALADAVGHAPVRRARRRSTTTSCARPSTAASGWSSSSAAERPSPVAIGRWRERVSRPCVVGEVVPDRRPRRASLRRRPARGVGGDERAPGRGVAGSPSGVSGAGSNLRALARGGRARRARRRRSSSSSPTEPARPSTGRPSRGSTRPSSPDGADDALADDARGAPRRTSSCSRATCGSSGRRCSARFAAGSSTRIRACCRHSPGPTPSATRSPHGVEVTGATVHLVDETLDGGPIVAQEAVPVLRRRRRGDPPRPDPGRRAPPPAPGGGLLAGRRARPVAADDRHRGRPRARRRTRPAPRRALLSVSDKTRPRRARRAVSSAAVRARLDRRHRPGAARRRPARDRRRRRDRRPGDARRPGEDAPPAHPRRHPGRSPPRRPPAPAASRPGSPRSSSSSSTCIRSPPPPSGPGSRSTS